LVKRGRPFISDEIELQIVKAFKEHMDWSLRKIAKEVKGTNHVTVMRVLKRYKLWITS
jgi:hypothetical protein